ncbi:MAG: Maf family protein [Anaerovoracaceae bacterium]
MKERKYVLASGSPRRIEMMRVHGIEPVIIPASIEENLPAIGGMTETVMFLALKKAKAVEKIHKDELPENSVIIAADTVVYGMR